MLPSNCRWPSFGVPAFHVGDTAAADKLLQRVALGLHWPAERVRLVGWPPC